MAVIKKSEGPRRQFDPNFDPAAIAQRAVAERHDPTVFEEIDERSMPTAPNIYQWVLGKEFLARPKMFAKQAEVLLGFLGQFCPLCTEERYLARREDRVYLNLPTEMPHVEVPQHVTMLEFGCCPKCGIGRNDLIARKLLMHHTEMIGCVGMRGSKSTTAAAFLGTYQLHRYLRVPNPSRYFDLLPNQLLDFLFVALTAEQANSTLWQPFKGTVDDAPWFLQYHALLQGYEKRLRRKLFKWQTTQFLYLHKRLYGTFKGADIGTLRGRTRVYGVIDEIAYFDEEQDSSKQRANAYGTRTLISKGLQTIRSKSFQLRARGENDPLDGYECYISSPVSVTDPIMTLLRDAEDDKQKYAFHYETPQFNPDISEESLRDEQQRDPKEYDRQYRAIPPLGHNPYIDSEPAVRKLLRAEPQSLVRWEQETFVDQLNYRTRFLKITTQRDVSRPRLLTIDTGHSFNSFALSLHSLVNNVDEVEMILEASPTAEEPINFPLMYQHCISVIVKNLNVRAVLFDRWQHLDLMTKLHQECGVQAFPVQLRKEHFDLFKAKIASTNISLPRPEIDMNSIRSSKQHPHILLQGKPSANAMMQILTVRKVGQTVTKPLNGNDDIFRTLVLGATYLFDPENLRAFNTFSGASGGRRSGGNKTHSVYLSMGGGGAPRQGSAAKTRTGRVVAMRFKSGPRFGTK